MFGFLKAGEPIADFWKTFATLAPKLKARIDAGDGEAAVNLLSSSGLRKLQRINPGLVFEFSSSTDDGVITFIVSANGLREIFDDAHKVVAAAPDIPGWRFVALRQPIDLSAFGVELDGRRIGVEDIGFARGDTKFPVALDFWFDVPHELPEEELFELACLLLDRALGEYDAVTCVSALEICYGKSANAHPLLELPAAMQDWKNARPKI